MAVVITWNLRLADMPGNVLIPARESGLPKPSVVNVTQVITADKSFFRSRAGRLTPETLERVEHGLSVLLGLV